MGEAAVVYPDAAEGRVQYRDLRERVGALKAPCFWPAMAGKPRLTPTERAGLVRLVDAIPGSFGEEEMVAVMEAMRHAPAGDVVEIGARWGRSAALFLWLARRYGVGKMLCVDPWETRGEDDGDEALRVFQINLAPLAQGDLNYMRATSADAAVAYGPAAEVVSEAFGPTVYEGRVAVLHLNGPTSEPQAAANCAAWAPRVVPGGWIVFDNYDWAFNGARRRVADAFVAANEAKLAARFEAGSALFVQLKR